MPKSTLTSKFVGEIACEMGRKRQEFFDTELPGFVLEVRSTGGKTFYARYRTQRGILRQFKLGSTKLLKVDEARQAARKVLARASLGEDPSGDKATLKAIPTFAEFVEERYLPFIKGYKAPSCGDEARIRNHITPKLGKKHLDQITKADIIDVHHGSRAAGAAPSSANLLLILIRYIFNLAIRWEVPGMTSNPAKGIPLFEENNKKERYLSAEESQNLYKALLDSDNTQLRYIVPMLLLTGTRKRELLDAKWGDFDIPRRVWRIPISKSGKARHVPLSEGVLSLLETIPQFEGCPYLLPNPKTRVPYVSIFYAWHTARTEGGLRDVRMHDLRHSFASFLINAGRSIYEVQKILGHSQIKTTQRYAHLSQETLLSAADAAMGSSGLVFAPVIGAAVKGTDSDFEA